MHLIQSLNAFFLFLLCWKISWLCKVWKANNGYWMQHSQPGQAAKGSSRNLELDKEQVPPFTSVWDDLGGFIFRRREVRFLFKLSNDLCSYERCSTFISSCYWKLNSSVFTKNTAARATFFLREWQSIQETLPNNTSWRNWKMTGCF